jgi:hypothetical protein
MKKAFCQTVLIFAIASSVTSAQDLRLPRDPQKLIARAQAFWAAIVAGRRLEGLAFVLPEKKDVFLSGSPMPIIRAQVLGLDLTDDPERALVRTSIETLTRDLIGGRTGWAITDPWVWRGDNWYLDLREAPDIFPRRSSADEIDITETQKKIDQNFQFLRNPVDLGRLIDGQQLRFDIPIKYSGDVPVSAEPEIANSLADLEASSVNNITSRTDHIVLLVNTEGWEGPFNLPLPIKIRNGAATIKRTLVIQGTVYAPITFRRDPPDAPILPDRPFSLFIRNNSAQVASIVGIRTDTKFEILKQPEKLAPNTEAEVVLKLKPDESPDRLNLLLDGNIEGRSIFTYRFQSGNR